MNKTLHKTALLAVAFIALAACQNVPLQNINDAPIHMTKHHYGLGDVEKAIVRAGTNLGWQMRTVKPGLIDAKLYSEDQVAEISINYSTSLYSIKYLNSQNMNYKAKAGKPEIIYEDYNLWVQELDKEIRKELLVHP
jgi:hypothetical protein